MTSYSGSVGLGSSLPGNASVNTPFQMLEDVFYVVGAEAI
jgi:hypothetical protein